MNAKYRFGLQVVLITVAVSALLATMVPPPRPGRAAQNLEAVFPPLPPFALVESSGKPISDRDLANHVWVASFIFTRCSSSCPRITSTMKGLQEKLAKTDVQLVSISVDPERDTPEILRKYADAYGADPSRWYFLTGPLASIYDLIRHGFKLAVQPLPADDPQAQLMEISHSSKLALVKPGNQLVGLFDAEDPAEVRTLIAKANELSEPWVRQLPTINATLNGTCTLLLLAALAAIRSGRKRLHIGLMATALVVSSLFLVSYLVYHAKIGGGVPFQGTGLLRVAYFTILISHVVLAAAVVPLVLVTVLRAIRGEYTRHALVARVTFPIWLYVSITGVVVYLMLYRLHIPAQAVQAVLGAGNATN